MVVDRELSYNDEGVMTHSRDQLIDFCINKQAKQRTLCDIYFDKFR